ncbi:MAG: ABC transporter permease [Clostridia bacterium]|nr:ABC transporter permease [Clostridia bacterium]
MKIEELIKVVFTNVLSNKFRVFLTMLGIIVGSATLVVVLGIGNGSTKSVEEQFSNLNVNMITIMQGRGRGSAKIDEEDIEYIKDKTEYLNAITSLTMTNVTSVYNDLEFSGSAFGIKEDFFGINNLEIKYGKEFEEDDNDKRRKKVIIGSEVAKELFEDEYAIGEYIKINSKRYEVIGVLEESGMMLVKGSADESIFVPEQTLKSYVGGKFNSSSIMAFANNLDEVEDLKLELTDILDVRLGEGKYMMFDVGSSLTTAKESVTMVSMMLASVAVIVLMVGGIGIMNVLFVSVKERTKEIGIFKALGTKKKEILLIFLIESLIISVLGAFVGILITILLLPIITSFGVLVIPTSSTYILAIMFSLVTGAVFGLYPAYQASNLKPIDALRYE